MPEDWPGPAGFVDADGRVVDVGGVRVAGLGGRPRYRAGPNQWSEAEQARRARRVVRAARKLRRRDGRGVDILLTHAPPRHCGDGEDLPHHGFECLHKVVAELQPRMLVHGHIHPDDQSMPDRLIGATAVVNVVGHRVLEALGPCLIRGTSRPTRRTISSGSTPGRQTLSQVIVQLQGKPSDASEMLLFDDVVAALGRTGERRLGLQSIGLATIVGSVDRARDFDCWFTLSESQQATLDSAGAGPTARRVHPTGGPVPDRRTAFRPRRAPGSRSRWLCAFTRSTGTSPRSPPESMLSGSGVAATS